MASTNIAQAFRANASGVDRYAKILRPVSHCFFSLCIACIAVRKLASKVESPGVLVFQITNNVGQLLQCILCCERTTIEDIAVQKSASQTSPKDSGAENLKVIRLMVLAMNNNFAE